MAIMLFTDSRQVRGQCKGTVQQLKTVAHRNGYPRWAIYREYTAKGRFHNATDEDFLICHDDTYWHNREAKGE